MVEKGGPSFNPDEEAEGVHAEVQGLIRRGQSLLEAFAEDPGVKHFLEPGVPEVERRGGGGSRALGVVEHYSQLLEKREERDRVLDAYARENPVREDTPEEKAAYEAEVRGRMYGKSYTLPEQFLPADRAPSEPLGPPSTLVFAESWEKYVGALYAIKSTLSLATTLLRQEQFRTPVGSGAWETLGGLAERCSEISGDLGREISAAPQGDGFVE